MNPEQAINRYKKLDSERSNWANYWQDLANFCLPRKADITEKNVNGEHQDFHRIFDGTAIRSLKVMAAGFHSHLTNPSSKWFEIKIKNRLLMEDKAVRLWLKDVEDEIFSTLNSSNFDSSMQEFYPDVGCFGTAAMFLEEDVKDKIRFTVLPIAEVFIEEDAQGRVNRIYRKFKYTAQQCWDLWGESAGEVVSKAIKEENYTKMIDLLHWIAPREVFVAGKEDALNMPFESIWIECTKKHVIKESGFHEFPVAVGRFMKRPGSVWGDSVAMEALADIKMLNTEKKTIIRAAMKIVDPPLSIPDKGYTMPLNFNPSGINYRMSNMDKDSIQPIMTHGNIPIGMDMVNDVIKAIEETFFVPLFRAFSQITKQMTIPEVNRRIAENMVLLGPVVGRFTQEVLDPVIVRTFNILFRNGQLPDPPEVLQDQEFDVVYISQLAKAQRSSEILSLERTLSTIAEIAQLDPSVLDKIDADKVVDIVAEINGTNPEIIRDMEEVTALRENRALMQAQQQELMQKDQLADMAVKATQAEKNYKESVA